MDELSVKCFLYAEYQVILASSACGMQEMVNKMNDFVKKAYESKCRDIKSRVNARNKANEPLLAIMNSKSVSRLSTMGLRMIVKAGNVQKKSESRINAVEMRSLRSMCGVSRKDKCKNSDVRERCGLKADVVTRVERGVLRWFGHLEKMNKVCDGKVIKGRPRKSYAEHLGGILKTGQVRVGHAHRGFHTNPSQQSRQYYFYCKMKSITLLYGKLEEHK
ncbi:hypothetical protein EVAR_100264_1 [Eumeta japonica]|uniref:Uncharacterized protein n=1 Tax=Eumeta variegata TaxID=151549 RepID=A0A4C1ZXC5_EUMVA|nr:hypothetical protein EVAR_100264_1 [Eumeta japonica]